MGHYFFILALFGSALLSVAVSQRQLCSRIFFQNLKESESPYKIIEGVYIKQNYKHNNFPVYQKENDNLRFYFNVTNGYKYLVFGLNFNNYFGVAADVYSFFDPVSWLSTGSLDSSSVFSGIARRWKYYNYRGSGGNTLLNTNIKAVCVDNDFRKCDSDRVYMNLSLTASQTGAVLNDPRSDYFSHYQSLGSPLYRNMRPVYKHSRSRWYLSYLTEYGVGYWVVTEKSYPTGKNDGAWLRVADYALRPEYITNNWFIHSNGWRENKHIKIRCRGISNGVNGCLGTNPCRNGGRCSYTSGNETLCLCSDKYRGQSCATRSIPCSKPTFSQPQFSDMASLQSQGAYPGLLASGFCTTGSPFFIYAVCQQGRFGSTWQKAGTCSSPTLAPRTTRPWSGRHTVYPWGGGGDRREPLAKPIDFDDHPAVLPAVLTTAVLLQVLLPFCIWLVGLCRTSCKETNEDQEDAVIQNQFTNDLAGRLNSVSRASSREQLDEKVQKYRETVKKFEKEKEQREIKRKRGVFRNVSLLRLYSMQLYFSFFLWLLFLIGCSASQCTIYGSIMVHLWRMSIAMCIIAPLFVLMESACSHERDYLKNIMEDESAWDYIRRMHAVRPEIAMTVECYHFETRTRVVTYTDANGNLQTRTETYQEKVTTYIDHDSFAFGSWLDASKKEMPQLSTVALTRLKIEGIVEFGDQETANDFERQKEEMIDRNRHRDVFQDFSCERVIAGLEKRISAYVDLRLRPYWMKERYYWLATLLFLTWPFRWYFRAKTAKNYYDIRKKLYMSASPPAEVDIMDPFAVLQQCQGDATNSLGAGGVNPGPGVSAIQMTPYPKEDGHPSPLQKPEYPPVLPVSDHGGVYQPPIPALNPNVAQPSAPPMEMTGGAVPGPALSYPPQVQHGAQAPVASPYPPQAQLGAQSLPYPPQAQYGAQPPGSSPYPPPPVYNDAPSCPPPPYPVQQDNAFKPS